MNRTKSIFWKRVLLFWISILLLFFVNIQVLAEEGKTGTCGENVTWSYDGAGKMVISGTGKMDDFTTTSSYYSGITTDVPWEKYLNSIEEVVIEEGITGIGKCAFSDCSALVKVEFSSTVTEIGRNAFARCISLVNVNMPDNIKVVDSAAFVGCSNLVEIKIPDGVTKLSTETFSGCTNLKSISLPEGLLSIGRYAFNGCKNLKTINLPQTLTNIEYTAFGYCSSLEEIELPETVQSLGNYAFVSCSALKKIVVKNKNMEICSETCEKCPAGLVIYGYSDSAVEKYASSAGYAFIALDLECCCQAKL